MRIGGLGQALRPCLLMFCFAGSGLAQSDPGLDGLNRTVVELYLAGRYAEGLPLAASAVALAERVKGPRDPAVATALNNYGEFLNRANRAPEAEEVYRRAVAIDDAAKSEGLSRDLNNLAGMLRSAHRLPEAEKLYVRALAVDEHNVGPRHRDIARDLNNIALLLRDEGKETDAEPLQRRAITILEDLLRENPGISSSELASALSNFAAGLPQDRAKEAESLYRRALELNEKELGTEHPNIAVNLNNLAEALRLSGKSEEAEALFRRALRIDESVLGPQNPTVATVLNNLAKVLRDTNRPAEAESLFNRALAIDQTSFGRMHPVVARDLKNLSKFFKIWNRAADAEPLMQRVIDILQDMERQSGSPVRELGPAFNFQAQLLTETNQLADAENCYRKALALDEKNYGVHSVPVERDLRGLAQLLKATQRPQLAASLSSRADEIAALAKRANGVTESKAGQKCLGDACSIASEEGI